jgi:hypothetical protein
MFNLCSSVRDSETMFVGIGGVEQAGLGEIVCHIVEELQERLGDVTLRLEGLDYG